LKYRIEFEKLNKAQEKEAERDKRRTDEQGCPSLYPSHNIKGWEI